MSCPWSGRRALALAGLMALCVGVPWSAALAQEAPGQVTGVITDESTGDPLEDVCVEAALADEDRGAWYDARTGADGRYALTVEPGRYVLAFAPCTPSRYSYEREVWNNRTGMVGLYNGDRVEVAAGQTRSGIDAALTPSSGAVIAGVVRDESGTPLPGVAIDVTTADRFDSAGGATTGDDGTYALYGLRAGSYVVNFSDFQRRHGVRTEYWDGAGGRGTVYRELATVIRLDRDEERTGVDAALSPKGTASLSGHVTAEGTEEPLDNICVEVFDVAEPRYPRSTANTAEAGGSWQVADLEAATYTVHFYGCGFARQAPEWWSEKASFDAADRVVLRDGEHSGGIDQQMPRNAGDAAVAGQVTDAGTGEALAEICVKAHRLANRQEQPRGGVTGPDGAYRITGLYAEDYVLSFNDCHFHNPVFPPELWDDKPFFEAATPVTLQAGQTTSGIDAGLGSIACPNGEVPRAPYRDVSPENVHRRWIDCMAWHDVASGTSARTFSPTDAVTRGQMAAFVTRALDATGVPLPARPADAFADDDGHLFERQINQLAALGVVRGTAAGRYSPKARVRRAAMATYLLNALEEATGQRVTTAGDRFVDDDGDTHEHSIDRAAAAGLVSGAASLRYAPGVATRRDQMTSMLSRLMDKVEHG